VNVRRFLRSNGGNWRETEESPIESLGKPREALGLLYTVSVHWGGQHCAHLVQNHHLPIQTGGRDRGVFWHFVHPFGSSSVEMWRECPNRSAVHLQTTRAVSRALRAEWSGSHYPIPTIGADFLHGSSKYVEV
jgi:hypothetical protein